MTITEDYCDDGIIAKVSPVRRKFMRDAVSLPRLAPLVPSGWRVVEGKKFLFIKPQTKS